MNPIILQTALNIGTDLGKKTLGEAPNAIAGNFGILMIGLGLLVSAILVFVFLKKIIINSILGLIAWAIAVFILKIELPFWISLIASALFGLAGVGVMLLLKFAGINL